MANLIESDTLKLPLLLFSFIYMVKKNRSQDIINYATTYKLGSLYSCIYDVKIRYFYPNCKSLYIFLEFIYFGNTDDPDEINQEKITIIMLKKFKAFNESHNVSNIYILIVAPEGLEPPTSTL